MITLKDLRTIENNGGLTLKKGEPIHYKTGYQVATEGIQRKTLPAVLNAVKRYGGNCGLWLENGIWYIDKSRRVSTKKEAMTIGRECNQISVLRWRDMGLVYC